LVAATAITRSGTITSSHLSGEVAIASAAADPAFGWLCSPDVSPMLVLERALDADCPASTCP
jgi:hypothetical protein